ncbi:MAG: histone H1 [Bacteroidetes bacterium]|nr:histone H1 [Bacteroidota bacterium]MCY4204847.1 histone H1 [Bacteroidota bacterium]
MNRYNELKTLVDGIEADFTKFHDGKVNVAGTRIRKAMLELRNLASEIRKEVQEERNSRKGN